MTTPNDAPALPDFDFIARKRKAGANLLTALETFIYNNEPAGAGDVAFRKELAAVIQEALRAASAASLAVPEGFVLVPREPTEAMIDMGRSQSSFPEGVYRTMLAAAPASPPMAAANCLTALNLAREVCEAVHFEHANANHRPTIFNMATEAMRAIDQAIDSPMAAADTQDAKRWRAVRDSTGEAASSAKFAVTCGDSEKADKVADAIIARNQQENGQ